MKKQIRCARLLKLLPATGLLLAAAATVQAVGVTGQCGNCHTMHNSQNNTATATINYGAEADGPYSYLLKGTCLGCHAMGTANNIETLGTSSVPQVYHTAGTDLAGGNFNHMLSGASEAIKDSKGHNVVDFAGTSIGDGDISLIGAPGALPFHDTTISDTNLTCSGARGCHGTRGQGNDGAPGIGTALQDVPSLKGAHHTNVSGKIDGTAGRDASTVGTSYRFLKGVYGYEDSDWQATSGAADHNEYYSAATPMTLGCATLSCHDGGVSDPVEPPNNTISGFCATCHPNFHSLDNAEPAFPAGTYISGVGTGIADPFIRHPTDVVIPNSGEFAGMAAAYNPNVPVGRTTLAAAPYATQTPDGATVTVTCLSCHYPHAGPNPDLLRFDYTTMVTGSGLGTGCFVCHTEKDD